MRVVLMIIQYVSTAAYGVAEVYISQENFMQHRKWIFIVIPDLYVLLGLQIR